MAPLVAEDEMEDLLNAPGPIATRDNIIANKELKKTNLLTSAPTKNQETHKDTTVQSELNQNYSRLRNALDQICTRVDERFGDMQAAFNFLDSRNKTTISFAEFTVGLEDLQVKLSCEDQFRCFKYLDQDSKEALNYNDFCNIKD